MFSKLALVASLAVLAVATPAPGGGGDDSQSCSTGTIQCCNSVQDASSPDAVKALGIAGVVGSVTGPVGLTCLPITAIGVSSGDDCSSQTVCCENDSFNGLVALSCTPININL